MVQNYGDSKHKKATMNVEKFYDESIHANYQHLSKNETRGYNLNEDEWTQRVPIDDASADCSLFKKKKKKKKGDKQMVQNEEGAINDKTTLNFDKLYDEVFHDNHQYLNKNETRDSNLNKDEWTQRVPIDDASADGSLLVSAKAKIPLNDLILFIVQNEEGAINDKTTLNFDKLYDEVFHDNHQYLNKNETRDSNLNKDEWTQRVPIDDASADCSLVMKKKKIKKGDKQMMNGHKEFLLTMPLQMALC
ncbi:uncharacterized protein LOC132932951 [Metopolophium dirhodum]|uniref:uncharacterized protein LOC132932951 n=1 Tax=Metopolophium dirhodum TaxID=44670 RepID=UPI0029905F4A|nr:uncharacterized protein LOC132932951 [Metopolophium dirhodum]